MFYHLCLICNPMSYGRPPPAFYIHVWPEAPYFIIFFFLRFLAAIYLGPLRFPSWVLIFLLLFSQSVGPQFFDHSSSVTLELSLSLLLPLCCQPPSLLEILVRAQLPARLPITCHATFSLAGVANWYHVGLILFWAFPALFSTFDTWCKDE